MPLLLHSIHVSVQGLGLGLGFGFRVQVTEDDTPQVARCIAPALSPEDRHELASMVPLAVRALSCKQAPLRQMASRFLAAMCVVEPLQSMEVVIRSVVPLLADASQPQRRLGATEALYKIVLAMDLQVCVQSSLACPQPCTESGVA